MEYFELFDGLYLLYIPDVNISKFSKLSDNLSSMTMQLMMVIADLTWIFEVKLLNSVISLDPSSILRNTRKGFSSTGYKVNWKKLEFNAWKYIKGYWIRMKWNN